jgi:hypothetical protein
VLQESLKISIKTPTLGGQAQAKIVEEMAKQPEAPQPVRPVQPGAPSTTSQAGFPYRSDRPSSPWMVENFYDEESREGKVEDR